MPFAIAPNTLMLTLLGAASLILYFAGRLAMGAIPARLDGPGVRSALAATPVMSVSLVAIALDRPLVGLHLPVACATAAMTFGLGAVLIGRPARATDATEANATTVLPGSRSWAFVVPAVAIALIGALGGALSTGVVVALATFGTLALVAWRADPRPTPATDVARRAGGVAIATWTMATIASAVAGAMAVAGLPGLDALRTMPSDALATAFLLSPAIVVPMVFELLPPCRPIGWQASVSSLARFSVICLCVALPLASLAAAARPTLAGYAGVTPAKRTAAPPTTSSTTPAGLFPTTAPATTRAVIPSASTSASAAAPQWRFPSLPSVAQRADLIVLAGASLLLLPLSLGAYRPGAAEAVALMMCYAFDLALTMAMTVR